MRMDPGGKLPAAVLVHSWEESELVRIFRALGEERRARPIARAIVRRREREPFSDTLELADCVAGVLGSGGRIHPATRVFQALRMTVNEELEALERVLSAAPNLLRPGGRMAVITFHSLEDRMVKTWFRRYSTAEIDRPEWPAARPNPELAFRLLVRRPVVPSDRERERNPRARSAKLRVVERLGGDEP